MTANEFTELEAKRDAMRAGTTNLLASLSLTRDDFAGMGDADILSALSAAYTKLGIKGVGADLLQLANTAREGDAAHRLADYSARHAAFGLSIAADIRDTGLRMTDPADRLGCFDAAARIVDEVRA